MGVKNLWDVLESCKKTLPLHHLQNKRVCIDLSCWMVQLQNVNRSHCAMKEKLYLRGLFHRLRALIALNCSLIFVTDGAIPAVKISTYRKRLNLVNEVAKDDTNGHKASSLRRNMGSEFSCMIKEAKTLGMALGIPCLDGIEEAEAQCASLNSESICDGCFTSDSDVFLFGARTVYRDICLGDGGYVVCYEMTDIEKKLGLGKHSLIALALLLGSDYSHGVHGFGPESACQVIRSVGEDLFLQRVASDGVSFLKSLKTSKKQGQFPMGGGKENLPPPVLDQQQQYTGNQHNLEGNSEFLRVIDAYMKPRCHSVDSDPVYRVLATYPFKRAELQQICDQFFGWPPEKTDEYILPRIAERELRKYANLRSSSSQLGLVLPLHKMPIKCPIFEVLKRRRVQGREYFEVSWVDFDGLETSIVPADLVERACPEKIAEFEEKRAQKKKQNCHKPRSKKSEDKASTANANLKLQELVCGIEYEDNARRGHSLCPSTFALGTSGKRNLMISGTFLSEQYESEIPSKPGGFRHSDSSTMVEMDVIDLLSPRPKKTEDKASLANVDLKLQELLLEIEYKDNARIGHSSCPSTSILRSCGQNDHTLSGTFLDEQCESKVTYELTRNCHSGSPTTMEMDVIDLSSPRPKKREDKASMTNVDLKPQKLLLEFDSEDKLRRGHSLCAAPTSGTSSKNDSTMLSTVLEEQDESKITEAASRDFQSDPPPTGEVDMIDLLSPSPEPRARHVSKCQGNAEQVSVIDLSDSDVEMMSPDHAQKARELRVFLASIREEIH